MFGIPDLYVCGAVGLVVAGLGGVAYVEHQRVTTAHAERAAAEHDRDQWRTNYGTAATAAANNAAALQDYKNRAAASSVAADVADAVARENIKKYENLLTKTRVEHESESKNPTSGFMRAYLDGLCREQTGGSCANY